MSDQEGPQDRSADVPRHHEADPTRPLPPQPPPSAANRRTGSWEAEVPARSPGDPRGHDHLTDGPMPPTTDEDRGGVGRSIAIGVVSAIVGFVLAFVVIAMTTDDAPDVADPGTQDRITDLEQQVADRDLQIEELQAQLAEAEAAAGESDADVEAQREALDERADALDQRAAGLDEREAALDAREEAIAEREAQADAEPEPDPDTQPDPDGGLTPPDIDEEDVQNIVDRVLERLRDLFN